MRPARSGSRSAPHGGIPRGRDASTGALSARAALGAVVQMSSLVDEMCQRTNVAGADLREPREEAARAPRSCCCRRSLDDAARSTTRSRPARTPSISREPAARRRSASLLREVVHGNVVHRSPDGAAASGRPGPPCAPLRRSRRAGGADERVVRDQRLSDPLAGAAVPQRDRARRRRPADGRTSARSRGSSPSSAFVPWVSVIVRSVDEPQRVAAARRARRSPPAPSPSR